MIAAEDREIASLWTPSNKPVSPSRSETITLYHYLCNIKHFVSLKDASLMSSFVSPPGDKQFVCPQRTNTSNMEGDTLRRKTNIYTLRGGTNIFT